MSNYDVICDNVAVILIASISKLSRILNFFKECSCFDAGRVAVRSAEVDQRLESPEFESRQGHA